MEESNIIHHVVGANFKVCYSVIHGIFFDYYLAFRIQPAGVTEAAAELISIYNPEPRFS